jgi:flagellar hook assembly protein FlgD
MKRLVSVIAALGSLLLAQAFAASATFTVPSDATTSAGIYDSSGVLVRNLWSNVRYNSGTYTASWNGLDDNGILRPNGQYELRVLSNNVQYTWEGVIGNTSDSFTGSTRLKKKSSR